MSRGCACKEVDLIMISALVILSQERRSILDSLPPLLAQREIKETRLMMLHVGGKASGSS
jgi:hypothetical protein